jgi:hypothetical protein
VGLGPATRPGVSRQAQQLAAFGHLVAHAVQQLAPAPRQQLVSRGALMVCSIFMASITASAWPRLHALARLGQEGDHLARHRRGQAPASPRLVAGVGDGVVFGDQRTALGR